VRIRAESYRTSVAFGSLVVRVRYLAAIERADAQGYEEVRDPGCERARLRPSGGARRPGELLVLEIEDVAAATPDAHKVSYELGYRWR
jgi:hypothetical protein